MTINTSLTEPSIQPPIEPQIALAVKQIEVFAEKYGQDHLDLLMHLAFPLAITADLAYLIRKKFCADIPWVAVSDCLLSSLWHEVDEQVYEIDVTVRQVLLHELRMDERFGLSRLQALAKFLLEQLRECTTGLEGEEVRRLHQLIADSYVEKQKAAKAIVKTINSLIWSQSLELIRVGMIVNSLATDFLSEYSQLSKVNRLILRYGYGDVSGVISEANSLPKSQVVWEIAGVNLLIPRFFEFETVTVNRKGEIINREQKSARYFREMLPGGVELDMVEISGGKFIMGSPKKGYRHNESPQHEVTVKPFFMGKYPVTQAQYSAIMRENPSKFKGENHPVEMVTWNNAVEFCERLSKLTGRKYSLPSESQWEYAGRAGTTTPFYFGETITGDLANYHSDYTYAEETIGGHRGQTTKVGIFPPNTFGLYDIHGNVWEWCEDNWHHNYQDAPNNCSAWISDDKNDSKWGLLRGGSWNYNPEDCRLAYRYQYYRELCNFETGFRVICDYIGDYLSHVSFQEVKNNNYFNNTNILEQESQPKSWMIQPFLFETVTVNRKGEIMKREQKSARYFREILPESIKLDMVEIPGGKFIMGSPSDEKDRSDDEGPQHEVTVKPFFMGKYPVTQAQYVAIMGENPSNFTGENCPVENVSWDDAVEFCEKLSNLTGKKYSLPSEAQWEYAARAGTTTPFYFGETIASDLANYNGNYTAYAEEQQARYRGETTNVGMFPPNIFGLYDIHGNVWEWCQDNYHPNYKGAPNNYLPWVLDNENYSRRILRGGSWFLSAKHCRVANRSNNNHGYFNDKIGFRVSCMIV